MANTFLKLQSVIFLIHIALLITFSTSDNSVNYKTRLDDYSQNTGQYVDSSETLRKMYFPAGAKLTLEPTLVVPVVDPDVLGIGSKLKMSFPVEILFHKIPSWKPKDLFEGYELWNGERNFEHGRHKRSFDPKTNSSSELSNLLCLSGGTERIAIFKKLEGYWNSYYPVFGRKGAVDGKACLLRTICEVHEYRMDCVYGTMGEVAKLVLSASKVKDHCDIASDPATQMLANKLKDYAIAETNGRNRQCKKYTKSCDISLFV